MTTHTAEATLFPADNQPKPKIILEFNTQEDRDKWLAAYHNSGEQEIDEYWYQDNLEPPTIKITEEN